MHGVDPDAKTSTHCGLVVVIVVAVVVVVVVVKPEARVANPFSSVRLG